MPTIVCPECGKRYNLPASAAGQTAKCACGKRFRIGAIRATAAGVSSSANPAALTTTSKTPQSATPDIDEDFWDEALKEEPNPAARTNAAHRPPASGLASPSYLPGDRSSPASASSAPKRKRKKSWSIQWGFDWGQVAGGALTFLIAGGLTLGLLSTTGRLYFWPAGVAVLGLFTCLKGLMGD